MKFGVVVFPGSNCDHDMVYALEQLGADEVYSLWHKERDLRDLSLGDCIVLPGGFSYGDYLRAGAIARFSPIMTDVIEFARRGGQVLGVCNGFQILCEAQLLPGVLLRNANQKFICRNVFIRPQQFDSPITSNLDDRSYRIPIAHAEGRYHCSDEVHEELVENNQVLFRYCQEDGTVEDAANPNGTRDLIAGICNKAGNVMGMMPHPERAADKALLNDDGANLFVSMLTSARESAAIRY